MSFAFVLLLHRCVGAAHYLGQGQCFSFFFNRVGACRFLLGLPADKIMASVQKGIGDSLMVLSVGAGSLAFSHVNDSGFCCLKNTST